jgi:hypothetical protein
MYRLGNALLARTIVIVRLYIPRFCSSGTIPVKDGFSFWHLIFFEFRSKALANVLKPLSPALCQNHVSP